MSAFPHKQRHALFSCSKSLAHKDKTNKTTQLHEICHKRDFHGNVTPQSRAAAAQRGSHLTDLERFSQTTWCKSMATIHRNGGYLSSLYGVGVGLYFSVSSNSFLNLSGDSYNIGCKSN